MYNEEDSEQLRKEAKRVADPIITETKDTFGAFLEKEGGEQQKPFDAMARAREELDWIRNSVQAQKYQNAMEKEIVKDVDLQKKIFLSQHKVDEQGHYKV